MAQSNAILGKDLLYTRLFITQRPLFVLDLMLHDFKVNKLMLLCRVEMFEFFFP